jgi:hypothetical protein
LRNDAPARPSPPRIVVEYLGADLLVQIGSATGMRYHFATRGARASVDARDAARMLTRGDLRRVAAADP